MIALEAGAQALADHQQAEGAARRERERKKQASAGYERTKWARGLDTWMAWRPSTRSDRQAKTPA
ncbi:hypothetical protein [Streptacidiphilus carbonis]|uniref:hypothetical protein n=1 Tax=Streptacidiphilus carbonis TaxID=105422 RepID=UPI0005AAF973|nr:hypothetical protein [Streptacidiphilus carbonis]